MLPMAMLLLYADPKLSRLPKIHNVKYAAVQRGFRILLEVLKAHAHTV